MNEEQELQELGEHVEEIGRKMMQAFVSGVTDIPESLFNKYSGYFHIVLLSSINFVLIDGMAQTATQAGTDKMANPDEVFQYLMKEVMEEAIKSYFLKRQITKEGAH